MNVNKECIPHIILTCLILFPAICGCVQMGEIDWNVYSKLYVWCYKQTGMYMERAGWNP